MGIGGYKLCISASASSCRYVASDGSSFACNSCADCTAAAKEALAWCSGAVDAGTSCVTQTVCASSTEDCAPGQRCNTALNPPVCQALYCGEVGSPCGGLSASDICASRSCVSGACAQAPDMALPCCPANELGVGKSCTGNSDCAGQTANVCDTNKCTFWCNGNSNCGTNALCETVEAVTMTSECRLMATYCSPYCM